VPSDYRIAPPVLVRMMGVGLAATGLLVLVAVVLAGAVGWPVSTLVTVTVGAWLLLGALAVVLPRLAPVVRLTEVGYEVRWVRGAGVRQGRWKDVEDVMATSVGGARCVVLRRKDGRTTTIPVDVVAGSADAFVRDLQQHLNRGHGYRPVR
jgi:hypothetical protein